MRASSPTTTRTRCALVLVLTFLVGALAGCVQNPGQSDRDGLPDDAVMMTSMGCMVLDLYPEDAPQTVANFVQYADDDFYQGTVFHRVIADFVIQGGGFTADGARKNTRAPIPLETAVSNTQWTLSMARTSDPDSGTSQFYVNVVDNSASLDPRAGSAGYAVFGKVIDGTDTADRIRQVPTGPGPNPGMGDWPLEPVLIYDVAAGTTDCDDAEGEYTPPAPVYGVEAGFVHADADDDDGHGELISSTTDLIPIWIRNRGNTEDTFAVDLLTSTRWNVSLTPSAITLPPGEQDNDASGNAYIITVEALDTDAIVARETPDNIEITIRSEADPDTSVDLVVRLVPDPAGFDHTVSGPASRVELAYAGSFDDGTEFDRGDFKTTLGSGATVAGFDYGLMGLKEDEDARIRFPPELGYGYSYHRTEFNGEWLTFDVTILEFL